MDTRKLLEFWNKNLPEKVDYASLVCAEGFASGFKYVYEDEYGYVVEETMKKLEELLEYKLLEEQKLLLILPYPVGTPLYFVFTVQGIVKDRIRRWQANQKGLVFCSRGSAYTVDTIGKTVFLTREQAEQKLKELQEGEKE
jgi:hypothetical protein